MDAFPRSSWARHPVSLLSFSHHGAQALSSAHGHCLFLAMLAGPHLSRAALLLEMSVQALHCLGRVFAHLGGLLLARDEVKGPAWRNAELLADTVARAGRR